VVIANVERSMTKAMTTHLLALDWGTSSLRAFLMHDGKVIDTRQSGHGIQHLPVAGETGFEKAFAAIAGDWVGQQPDIAVVASGMVGSAQGWREAPYVACPADIEMLAQNQVSVASGLGPDIVIAPGVVLDQTGQLPDVMRGEEIQIAGALSANPQWATGSCIVLPGTHSKWVVVEHGKIRRFSTYMTGELFAVLCHHSILGRLMPESSLGQGEPDWAAFEMGLSEARRSRAGDLTHQLFATRTLGLTGRLPHGSLADYLSGLLIGSELVSGLANAQNTLGAPLIIVGESTLCLRYARALRFLEQPAATLLGNTAALGLWKYATAVGMIERSSEMRMPT
jgi:2-dehydro-3-deoxygalactonokinase